MTDYKEDEVELSFLGELLGNHKSAVCPPSSLISAYSEGNLSSDEMRIMEEHISHCADCEEIVAVVRENLHEYQEKSSLNWESLRGALPGRLPAPLGKEYEASSAREPEPVTVLTDRVVRRDPVARKSIHDYLVRVIEFIAPAGRPFKMTYALTATVMIVLLFTTIVWISVVHHGGDSDITRGAGTPHPGSSNAAVVTIAAEGLIEPGTVQVARSPKDFPIASLPVEPASPSVTCTLPSGEYWVRMYGDKSESTWQKIEVQKDKVPGKPILLRSAGNILLFSPSNQTQSLIDSVISYRMNDKSYSFRISSPTFETGPYTKGVELNNVMIQKGKALWRYPGTLKVKGGRQIIEVTL